MTTRQPIFQTLRPLRQHLWILVGRFVIIMAIVFMTVDYGSLKGGDAHAADTWDD